MENKNILCVCNQKGGVGKTTTVSALAQLLTNYKKKILIVDCDPQGNISQLYHRFHTTQYTIADIFTGNQEIEQCIVTTDYEDIDIIPGDENFTFTAEDILLDHSRISQYILKNAIEKIKKYYDYILIDNSPTYNIITINTLCASKGLLIPLEADGYSFKGFEQLLKRIREIQTNLNPALELLGIFLTNVNCNTTVFQSLYKEYELNYSDYFLPFFIRHDENAKKSATAFQALTAIDTDMSIVRDYTYLLSGLNLLDDKNQTMLENNIDILLQKEQKTYKSKRSFFSQYIENFILQKNRRT